MSSTLMPSVLSQFDIPGGSEHEQYQYHTDYTDAQNPNPSHHKQKGEFIDTLEQQHDQMWCAKYIAFLMESIIFLKKALFALVLLIVLLIAFITSTRLNITTT